MKTLLTLLDKVTKNETVSMYFLISLGLILFVFAAPIIIDIIINAIYPTWLRSVNRLF